MLARCQRCVNEKGRQFLNWIVINQSFNWYNLHWFAGMSTLAKGLTYVLVSNSTSELLPRNFFRSFGFNSIRHSPE